MQLWITIGLLILTAVSLRFHLRLRERLKGIDGWKERWERTVKWVYFGAGATSFDYQIQFAVLRGSLSRAADPGVRRDARTLRAVLIILFLSCVVSLVL